MKQSLLVALSAAWLAASPAYAGAGHDHSPRYGGIVRDVGALSYELVAKADSLTLYVSDHGKPVDTRNMVAEATLHAGSEKLKARLEPAGGNRLAAKGNFKVGVGVRAALVVTGSGLADAKATFNLK
jgi:hypothetical protein